MTEHKPLPVPHPLTSSTLTPSPSTTSPTSSTNSSKTSTSSLQNPKDPKYNSPGNPFKIHSDTPLMSLPNLNFIWRCECDIARQEIDVGIPHSAGIRRSIANIVGGVVDGPSIKGKVLGLGGADWATVVEGTHSMTLDARYTVITDDNVPIYVQAHGLYRPGPETDYARAVERNPMNMPPDVVTQDDVEFFSHLRLEAAGDSKYNWVNGLICVGVMTCVKERVVIDCYYLTNFPERRAESVVVRKVGKDSSN